MRTALTASEAFDRFITSRERRCRAGTVANYRGMLDCFEQALPPGILIEHVTTDHIDALVADETVTFRRWKKDGEEVERIGRSTVAMRYRHVRSCFR